MIASETLQESPEYVRLSLAAAMTLGLRPGRFWRGAKLTCINLLLTYEEGCAANCAYCGLARERGKEEESRLKAGLQTEAPLKGGLRTESGKESDGSFIRVRWPVFSVETVVERMKASPDAHRVCISMIARRRAVEDSVRIARAIRGATDIPISCLISPTVVGRPDLEALKAAGVDKIGVAFDAAEPAIFDAMRGSGAHGPHRWERYWECFAEAIAVFGRGEVGSHFIVGLGETERQMAEAFQRVRGLGGMNHLFSFYPEAGTTLESRIPPPMEQYRRMQIAAEIIDRDLARAEDFSYDDKTGAIAGFGVSPETLDRLIDEGAAFMTRGCAGRNGRVACNRPFANSAPGPGVRNYPFDPNDEDVALIREQLAGDWIEPQPVIPAGRTPKGARRNPRKLGRMHFFAPAIKRFETDEFSNGGKPVFVPISITGEQCDLQCRHCEGRLLKGMRIAQTPEALLDLLARLREEGCRGFLLTGGCDTRGIVPLAPFAEALARAKSEMEMKTAVHTKFLDEPLARALSRADADLVMIDVAGDEETLREVCRLPEGAVRTVEKSIELGSHYGLALAPHIVLGAHNGRLGGEDRALDMLRGRRLAALVIALLMPLGREARETAAPPDVERIEAFFRRARREFPDTPLGLGCARPMGDAQRAIDLAALRAGFDGIAYPAEGTVAAAREMGLRPVFSEFCCALMC